MIFATNERHGQRFQPLFCCFPGLIIIRFPILIVLSSLGCCASKFIIKTTHMLTRVIACRLHCHLMLHCFFSFSVKLELWRTWITPILVSFIIVLYSGHLKMHHFDLLAVAFLLRPSRWNKSFLKPACKWLTFTPNQLFMWIRSLG